MDSMNHTTSSGQRRDSPVESKRHEKENERKCNYNTYTKSTKLLETQFLFNPVDYDTIGTTHGHEQFDVGWKSYETPDWIK